MYGLAKQDVYSDPLAGVRPLTYLLQLFVYLLWASVGFSPTMR